MSEYCVDIILDAGFSMEFVKKINPEEKYVRDFDKEVALRYRFNLRPCAMTCVLDSFIFDERLMQHSLCKGEIFADKYLLPLLFSADDYQKMADAARNMFDIDENDVFDPEKWIANMGLGMKEGVFSENAVLGESFFRFGTADIMIEGKPYHVPAYDEVHRVGSMWKAYYYLSIVTGMRRGEICPLHWTDIDFDAKKVTITKSYNTYSRRTDYKGSQDRVVGERYYCH